MEDIEKLKSQIENLEKQINVFNEEYNKKLKDVEMLKNELKSQSENIIASNNASLAKREAELNPHAQNIENHMASLKKIEEDNKKAEPVPFNLDAVVERLSTPRESRFEAIVQEKIMEQERQMSEKIIESGQESILAQELKQSIVSDLEENNEIQNQNQNQLQSQSQAQDIENRNKLVTNMQNSILSGVKSKFKPKKKKSDNNSINGRILFFDIKRDLDTYNRVYSYDWDKIIGDIYNSNEDYLVAFYRLYINLDDIAKAKEINNILFSINKYYQTNYLSLEDFLAQNNFSTLADLQLYTEEFASTPKEGRG